MKTLLAASLFLAATSAYTQELSFGDVNYFLKEKQLNLTSDINSTVYTYSYVPSPAASTDSKREGFATRTRLAYALADNLNVFVGLNYDWHMKVVDNGASAYTQNGLGNPLVGANYRLINQNRGAMNVDFGAVLNLNIEEQKIGSAVNGNTTNGNAANGRSGLELNSRIGRKWNEANEWQAGAGIVYNNTGTVKRTSQGAATQKLDVDPSTDAYLRGTYQYRPVREFMMAVTLQATRIAQVRESNSTTNYKSQTHTDGDFIFNAKYLITDNFIFKFNYSQGMSPDYHQNIAGVENRIQHRHRYVIGGGIDWLF